MASVNLLTQLLRYVNLFSSFLCRGNKEQIFVIAGGDEGTGGTWVIGGGGRWRVPKNNFRSNAMTVVLNIVKRITMLFLITYKK